MAARNRPKTNFLLTDDDVIPKVEGGALVPPTPDAVTLPENPPDNPWPLADVPPPIGDGVETDPGLSGGYPMPPDGVPAEIDFPGSGNPGEAGPAPAAKSPVASYPQSGDTRIGDVPAGGGASGPASAMSVIDGLNARAASPDRGNHVHYESRISIVDAWQYPGSLRDAPDWVDKNWAAYGDYDAVREIEAGPALRVPLASGLTVLVRIGDYVARQEVKITRDIADVRLEVWAQDQFEKLFYPVDTRVIEHEVEGAAV